jgi:hypothetical protein
MRSPAADTPGAALAVVWGQRSRSAPEGRNGSAAGYEQRRRAGGVPILPRLGGEAVYTTAGATKRLATNDRQL